MSVETIKKIEIIALTRIKAELLDILQHHGILHITNITDVLSEASPFTEPSDLTASSEDAGLLGQIEYVINYLKRFDTDQKGFLESLKAGPIKISSNEIQSLLSEFDLEDIIRRCKEIDQTAQNLETEKHSLKGKLLDLENWADLDMPLKDLSEGTKFLDFYPLLISSDQVDLFKDALESACSSVAIYEIQDMRTYKSILVMALKADSAHVEEEITHYEAQVVSLPSSDQTAEQLNKHYKNRLAEIEEEKFVLDEKGESLLSEMDKLKILFDHFQNKKLKREINGRFAFTDQTFIITGWIRERDMVALKQGISHLNEAVDMEILDPEKDETPPVALTNNRFSSSFELVTKLYDLPHYRELDPTPVLAPFFFLFFGICLTDLGYGLLLAGVAFWGLKRLYLDEGKRKLLQLFFLCGISTIICGALAGSWFGDIFNYLPAWLGFLRSTREALTVIDPIKEPLIFLIIALALGFIQVITGICVQMYKDIKANDHYAAFLLRIPWVVLLTSLILLIVLKSINDLPAYLIQVVKWFAIVSTIIICLCEGRRENNIFKRLGTGLIALYGIVGYYADMLSYCRLLALGLATAVIANVVNQMAILSKGIPYVGIVFMAVILVGGHIFNLIINCLGAFVHTSRLQFVEFFTKFFEGGGKPFIPFSRQNKYSYVE
ncbi:MAG: V-type ATP synthase subunit I [bacterium]